jgi:RNA polymerase sigma-70 factor (ECF subfamily)
MTDTRVMEEVKEGRVERLAVLFERHHVKLYNFFLRLTRNRSLSEDLTQDVFVRLLKYKSTFQPDRDFTVWLYAIARNAHLDHLRKNKNTLPLDETARAEEPAPCASPASRMERDEAAVLMRQALEKLPPAKKEVLILSRYQDMKYAQIADVLHCRVGTVKVNVHRAMKELSRIYLELQGGLTP